MPFMRKARGPHRPSCRSLHPTAHPLERRVYALEGSYVYEAPGETHTLVVDPHIEEMITIFQVNGAMIYCDPDGNCTGYDDVFTRIEKCRNHYINIGLGEGYVDQFIR